MKTTITTFDLDPLCTVMTANYTTIGKEFDLRKCITLPDAQKRVKWKELLEAEHSTLAFAPFLIRGDFRSDVMHQLARSTKGLPRFAIQSHRPDWIGKERPPADTLRGVMMMWNPLSWMAMCRERLCTKAMKETRDTVYELCLQMQRHRDPMLQELGYESVPMCYYRRGCPYGKKSCGSWEAEQQQEWGVPR